MVRNDLNIPQNAFVCSYVGRHTEVKGYPDFLKLWEKYKDNEELKSMWKNDYNKYLEKIESISIMNINSLKNKQ